MAHQTFVLNIPSPCAAEQPGAVCSVPGAGPCSLSSAPPLKQLQMLGDSFPAARRGRGSSSLRRGMEMLLPSSGTGQTPPHSPKVTQRVPEPQPVMGASSLFPAGAARSSRRCWAHPSTFRAAQTHPVGRADPSCRVWDTTSTPAPAH